jgi:parallel beta-helix repeat protein
MRIATFLFTTATALYLLLVHDSLGQGSLTPPTPPGPSMKSLDQIDTHVGAVDTHVGQVNTAVAALATKAEKRIAISNVTIINAPGSYYLASDVTAPDGVFGIQVQASDVTIDLNGFSIIGQGSAASAGGIMVHDAQQNICIKNGTITGFHAAGITGDISSSRFEKLIVSKNTGIGISISNDSEVRDCVITQNTGGGVLVGYGCRIVQSIVTSNGGRGIEGVDHNTVESCTIVGNNVQGVILHFGSVVRNCTLRANKDDAIFFAGGSQIIGNTCDANGNDGIYTSDNASRIEGNTCTYNASLGISVAGSVNVIVRNTCRGNGNGTLTDNYHIFDLPNVYGQIVDMSSPGQVPNSAGPWSNISY